MWDVCKQTSLFLYQTDFIIFVFKLLRISTLNEAQGRKNMNWSAIC